METLAALLPVRRFCQSILPALLLWACALQAHATPVFEPVQGFVRSPENPQAKLIQASDGDFYGTACNGGRSGYGTVFKMTAAGTLTTLVNFTGNNGSSPQAGLVQGSDGDFYGTTYEGGSGDYGTVFKMTPTGTLTTLVNFTYTNGSSPSAALVQGSDGDFYGTTYYGGTGNAKGGQGTVFKMTPTGTLTTLVHFTGANGRLPYAALVQASDGNFYGTTEQGGSSGGASGYGTVFKMTPTGTLTTLVNFTNTNGSYPEAGLVQDSDGDLYGTTAYGGSGGGTNGYGTVFKMTPAGTLTTLVNFTSTNGSNPCAALVQGSDGDFYGTTYQGGNGYGTVFRMTPAGTLASSVNFTSTTGRSPCAALVQGSDGNFYGTTYYGSTGSHGTAFKMTAAGTLTTLLNFTSANGLYPQAALIQGNDGDFYGTTTEGGTAGGGTVFKMTPAGTLTTLVNFTGPNGRGPTAALVQGSDGNFYGTTTGGDNVFGTVFKMTPAGTLTTLVNFNNTNGSGPAAALVQGSDGDFYGTTVFGGATTYGGSGGYGTVFKMTPAGTLTSLVDFIGSNGHDPCAPLVQGSDGNFYGTTYGWGDGNLANSYGTVFKMTPAGTLISSVSCFSTKAALVQGSDGDFYGTTTTSGVNFYSNGTGMVFKMTPAGTLTTVMDFGDFETINGSGPAAALVQGSDGNFYGTTAEGGTSGYGTVFKTTPTGTLTTLVNFTGANGSSPYAGLMQGRDGNLYGTTSSGGSTSDGQLAGGGQIYRLRMGPAVLSQAQTNVTGTGATLNGTVNPGGYTTPVSFQYGTDPTLTASSTASADTLPVGTTDTAVLVSVVGLVPNTTYYYRVLASNVENTVPQSGSILSFTTPAAEDTYSSWASTRFAAEQLADPLVSGPNADPDQDGVVNLLEWAFKMPPLSASNQVLTPDTGTAGLPRISTIGSGATTRLRIEYIRRKAGLTYTPQFSSSPAGWATATGTETVQSIDSEWARVTVEDASGQPRRFGRLQVTSSP